MTKNYSTTSADRSLEIKVDASRTVGELKPFWASQIIHPTEFLRTEWGREFAQLLAETGAARQYIRIYNQPEYAVRIDSRGNLSFDWSHFDEMAEIIISTGNKLQVVFFAMVPVTIERPHEYVSSYATRDEDRISIVAVNFQNDKIFNVGPSYSVSLQLESDWSPETSVTVRHWRIDENHSNAYTAFRGIGAPHILNPLEMDNVKNRMHLELLETPVDMPWKEAQNLQFELPCNAVSLIEIIRNP